MNVGNSEGMTTNGSIVMKADSSELLESENQPPSTVSLGEQARPDKSVHRQVSVSEAAESNDQVLNAPIWLRWFEIPFHVQDPIYGTKLPEAAGWAMDSVGRGPLNQVGSYVGNAILRLAAQDAGCAKLAGCELKTHGFRPSSLLTATTSIVGVISAVLMPIVGALVDHTEYRRMLGIVSGFLSVALIGAQMFISEDNWFGMLVVDAVQTFVYVIHTTSVFAYLPDLSLDPNVISHYTSQFNLRQYVGQFIYIVLVIIAGQVRGSSKSIQSSVQTARDSAGIAFGFGCLFIGYAWLFLFRDRPPLSNVPEGATLLTAGFRRIGKTSRKIWKDYRQLRWFMASLLFSPEAGAGVVLSIAVTFITVFMKFSALDLAKASLVLMGGNVVGSIFSKWVCRVINPLNSYRLGMFSLGVGMVLAFFVMTGPERRGSVFGIAGAWGFSMGWTYPSQRVLFCTLIPKGQETEFMGLFVFVGQILGWLPSLLFTIINENGVSIRWGLPMVGFFCVLAVFLTLPMGSYEDAIKVVAEDSQEKLKEVVEATSKHKSRDFSTQGVHTDEEMETVEDNIESTSINNVHQSDSNRTNNANSSSVEPISREDEGPAV
ncbi:hypothetical protein ACA910_017760 [Epithemia clementina (nom. ined.)]